ncbi:WxL domain-containing protein [Bacillus cereus]|uniref:WxL domain-containing protein n=1 Tax=Bacillus cereus TaxID=1396 RepID=UPI002AC25DA0|nr:WxL domain-containing protein [Bacillus cereus]MDA2582704.1 WxL domain-containing protein [Bacillus cereus]MDZ4566941.1 WxL domain-containing protein [Bacillus cereus]
MKLTKLALAGAVSFSTVLAAGAPTFAAEDGGTLNSKAFIKFEKNTEIVNPVSPLDPSVEVETKDPKDPKDPHEPGTQGPLSIDYVSNFQFEKHKASGNNEIYYASLDSITKKDTTETMKVPNYVQVTDNRGTNVGWKLSVTQNDQFKTAEGRDLTGAALTLKNGTLHSASGSEAPKAAQDITLTPGQASDVVTAQEEQGMGTWVNTFGKSVEDAKKSVELSVPGKTKKEQAEYTTSLTWELKDAPM